MEEKPGKPPVREIRCWPVKGSAWLNLTIRNDKIVDVPLVKINRSYKDRNTGEWKNVDTFYIEDLPKVAMVATELYRYFHLCTGGATAQEQQDNDKLEANSEGNSTLNQ